MSKKTFVVTWQTVIEMNEIDDKLDIPWAVCLAEEKMRQLIANPGEGDNYFVVQEVTNRPAQKHFVSLEEAFKASWDAYWAESDYDGPPASTEKNS